MCYCPSLVVPVDAEANEIAMSYAMEDGCRCDGSGRVISAQSRAQTSLQALHVWVGAEEVYTGAPGRV